MWIVLAVDAASCHKERFKKPISRTPSVLAFVPESVF
jgi:hypothetical protein